jgi:hypothetical protein
MTARPATPRPGSGGPSGNPDFVYLNGIDPETGMYAVQPVAIDELASAIRSRYPAPSSQAIRADFLRSFAAPYGIDLERLEDAGWAVVFHEQTGDDVRQALQPLVEHRRAQAGGLLKILDYKKGEQVRDWCFRHRVVAGNLTPERVPYYLLIVGPPSQIPFEFQHELGVEYAVGRLDFDRPVDFGHYARSVVDYERRSSVPNAKEIVFWAPRHAGDPATGLTTAGLVDPLARGVQGLHGPLGRAIHTAVGYEQTLALGGDATRERLLAFLRAPRPPAVLFLAAHGVVLRPGRSTQTFEQGGLLCQDWPGFGSVRPEHFFAAADVPDGARVGGMVAFLFASFGAGTPAEDRLLATCTPTGETPRLADRPFVAELPKRLLSHPDGAALAVVGHVDRAWGFSVQSPGPTDLQTGALRNSLGFILGGSLVGHVVSRQFGQRHAALSAGLLGAVSPFAPPSMRPSDRDLVTYWLERNDAQNYAVLGDPAVRIRAEQLA